MSVLAISVAPFQLSEIEAYCRFCAPASPLPPTSSLHKISHVPLGVRGWPLGYEERRCWASCPCT